MSASTPYDQSNVFAKILRGEMPCHRVFEDAIALAFMDIMPRAEGHVLVIPKAEARTILEIGPNELGVLMQRVQAVAKATVTAMSADGLTIHQFNEPAGGQVVFHLHFHVLPRWNGVPLRPHAAEIERPETLEAHAQQIRAALSQSTQEPFR